MNSRTLFSPLALVLLLTGCPDTSLPAGPPDADRLHHDGGTRADDGSTMLTGLTYRGDVAPILAEHCLRCHGEGGLAYDFLPFDTYDRVALQAGRIAIATLNPATGERIMPPYYADNSGDCQTHRDANWLSDDELQVIADWAATPGHPEGDASIVLPDPRLPTTLDRVDGQVAMGFDFTPAPDDPGTDDIDELRCFLVQPEGLTTDMFLTGYQVRSSNPNVVHHVIVYEPDIADPAAAAAPLEAEDARDGWRCDGGPQIEAHPVVLWAPGVGATHFPDTTGLRLVAGRPVVLQIHFNMAAGTGPDRTTVDLELASSVPLEAQILPVSANPLSLAPGMARESATDTTHVPMNGRIWGVLPHMHQRGVEMRVDLTGGEAACLLQTVHWDFHWQQAYFFETPVSATRTQQLEITCTYDTRDDDDVVTWGERTSNEMCLNYVYATR
jgi:hypothetical protein